MLSVLNDEYKQNFMRRIKELGGRIIGDYKGDYVKVECICQYGHRCNITPKSIQTCYDMCSFCIEINSDEINIFIRRIEKLGGKVIGKYRGDDVKIKCVCQYGHECKVRPCDVNDSSSRGSMICKICLRS